MKKIFTILILTSVIVSGCILSQQKPDNTVIPSETEGSQVDTSDLPSEDLSQEGWKTYRNEEYGFEFMYPDNISREDNQFYSKDYLRDNDFIERGFQFSVKFENLNNSSDWRAWVGRPGGAIGKTVYTDGKTDNGKIYISKVSIGDGFADQWPLDIRITEINILDILDTTNIVVTFVNQEKDVVSKAIIEEIINSLEVQ